MKLLKKILARRRKQRAHRRHRKLVHGVLKLLGTVLKVGVIGFIATFALYMFNGENKLIYYVIRPLLNKHYDSQVRDRKI